MPFTPNSGQADGSDLVFLDANNQLFVYRVIADDSIPLAYKVPEWTVFTPALPVRPSATQISNYATETGGNLEALNDKIFVKRLDVDLVDADVGLITNTVIHGRCTSHGGEFVDVKVSHSGALVVDTSGSESDATLIEINQRIGKYANLRLSDVDESVEGTVYLLKQGATSADPWLLMKLVETTGVTSARYAGVTNNPTITLATAWANRASLVYGLITEA